MSIDISDDYHDWDLPDNDKDTLIDAYRVRIGILMMQIKAMRIQIDRLTAEFKEATEVIDVMRKTIKGGHLGY
jgi:hypothetical protein